MEKVIVFGNSLFAEVGYFYLTHDSPYEVAAFTVDREFMKQEELFGLPVAPFEDVVKIFPPSLYKMALPISFRNVNRLREEKYLQAKAKGYELVSYVSSRACTWPGLVIGSNSSVGENCSIQPFARIGNDVIITTDVTVGHHAVIEDHCFLAPGAVILGGARVMSHCVIGANAIIREGITVAKGCVVGASVLITRCTKEGGIYVKSPPKEHLRNRNDVRGRSVTLGLTRARLRLAGVVAEDVSGRPGLPCSVVCGLKD